MTDHLNQHSAALRNYFFQLYKDQSLCDVSFITKNCTTILAHKLVVSAFSGAVRVEVERWKDLPHVSMVVECEEHLLRKILEFVYTGTVNVNEREIPNLLEVCQGLQIPALQAYLANKLNDIYQSISRNADSIADDYENIKGDQMNMSGSRSQEDTTPNEMFDDDFVVSDASVEEIYDDTDGDETWTPEKEINETKKKILEPRKGKQQICVPSRKSRSRFKQNKQFPNLKQASVCLERINVDTLLEPKNSNSISELLVPGTENVTGNTDVLSRHSCQRYTRRNLTELAGKNQRINGTKHLNRSLSKNSFRKVLHSIKKRKKRSLAILTSDKISKILKQKNVIQKNQTGYSCKICKYWNKYMSVIRLHIGISHGNRKLPHKIRKYKKTFTSARQKSKIKRIKKKIKNFQCFKCNRKYTSMRGLATHLIEKHKYSAKRAQQLTGYPKYFVVSAKLELKCEICGEKFDELIDLRSHCRAVHKKKRLDPDIPCVQNGCEKKFHNVSALRKHLATFHKVEHTNHLKFREKTTLNKKSNILKSLAVNEKNSTVYNASLSKGQENKISQKRTRQKRKIFLPSKKYVCKKCTKTTVYRNKMAHQQHIDVQHQQKLITKEFESRLVVWKWKHYISPTARTDARSFNKETCERFNDLSVNPQAINGQEQLSCFRPPSEYIEMNTIEQGKDLSKHSLSSEGSEIIGQMHNPADGEGKMMNIPQNQVSVTPETPKETNRNQSICRKCGLSFDFFSTLLYHYKRKHTKFQFGQRKMYSKVRKHVLTRKTAFSRTSDVVPIVIGKKIKNQDRKIQCIACNKLFTHIRGLASHLQAIHKYSFEQARKATGYPGYNQVRPKSVKCMDCDQSFTEVRNWASHLQSRHKYTFEQAREATGYPSVIRGSANPSGAKPTPCDKCSEILPSFKSYLRHKVNVHGIKCKFCEEMFGNIRTLKKHGLQMHLDRLEEFQNLKTSSNGKEDDNDQESVFNCEKCDFSTTKVKFLTLHVIDVHPEFDLPCPVCGFTFRNKSSLQRHMLKHHGEAAKNKPKCKICKKTFLRPVFLRVHAFKVHGIPHSSLKEYYCDVDGCSKVFYTLGDLKQHKHQVHAAVRKHPCAQCNFVATTRSRLSRHIRSVHLQIRPHLCESCGKAYSEEQHLKEHIRKFHSNDYYELQCEYCPFRCGIRNQLQTHMWRVHNIKMVDDKRTYFQCDRCAYQTPLKHKFRNHMNRHDNVRNYACNQCDQKFVTSSTLRTHKLWKHSAKEEERVCNQCGYKTKTSQKLNEHIRVQHQLKGIKPYKCPYCEFTCATGGNCRKHVMGKHKGKEVRYEVDRDFLEVAKMARKEGNNNPLIVQVQNIPIGESEANDMAQILDPSFPVVTVDPIMFNQFDA